MFRSIGKVRLGIDIAIAIVFFAVSARSQFYFTDSPALVPLIAGIMAAALAVRRLSPALSLAIAWLGAIVQMALLLAPLPSNLAVLGVLYVTAAYGSRLVLWLGAASVVVGSVTVAGYLFIIGISTTNGGLATAATEASVTTIAVLLGFALAWTAGALVRTMFRAREIQDAKRIADAVAQAEQERARIARDMHDVVAHSLAVVVAQANGARYAGRADPQIALDTLGTISQTAGSALADVRVLLAQLRHREAEGPQPSIADIDALFAQIRRAGDGPHHRHRPGAARRCASGGAARGVPDPAGGAHERAPPRRRRAGRGVARVVSQIRAAGRVESRRGIGAAARLRARTRHHRHAGTRIAGGRIPRH